MWTVLCGWLLAMTLVSGSRPRLESTCDTLANKIHLTKEEFNKAKELMRTCEEDVELMKCEGACVSTTMPSAMERSEYIIIYFYFGQPINNRVYKIYGLQTNFIKF